MAMKTVFTIVAMLGSSWLFGQQKYLYNTTTAKGDSSFWYKHQIALSRKLSLPLLNTSSNNEYYRICTDAQVIDLWEEDSGDYYAKLT